MPGSAPPARSSFRSTLATAVAAIIVAAGLVAMPTAASAAPPPGVADSAACGEAGVVNQAIIAVPDQVECRYANRSADGIGGAPDTFTVPSHTHSLDVTVHGGRNGGLTTAKLAVQPGQVLQVNVGGRGEYGSFNGTSLGRRALGGWNGGGTGGTDGFGCTINRCGDGGSGATDVRTGAYGLTDRVLVAGGAGGNWAGDYGMGGGLNGRDGSQEGTNSIYAGKGDGGSQLAGGYGGGNASGGSFGGGGGGGDGKPTIGGAAIGGGGGGGGWYGGGGGSGRYYGFAFLVFYAGTGGGGSGHAGAGTSDVVFGTPSFEAAHVVIRSIPDDFTTTTTVTSSPNPSNVGDDITFSITTTTADPSRIPLGGGDVTLQYNVDFGTHGSSLYFRVPLVIQPGTPGRGTATITMDETNSRGLIDYTDPTLYWASYVGYSQDQADGTFTVLRSQSDDRTQTIVRPPVVIVPVAQTITAPELTGLRLDGPDVALGATASSGLPVTYLSSTPEVCSVEGTAIRARSGGVCTVAMIQPGNEYFLPAPSIERSATITRLPQTIRFLPYTGQAAVVGTVQLGASSSANRLVVFSSLTPEVCAVDTPADTYNTQSTGYARTLKAGTCTVAADQPGDESVEPAEQIRTSFDLPKLPQKVSFRTPGVARPGDDDVLLYAGSNYGLPVTVTTSTPDVCTILSDAFVRPLAAGTCTVSVDQPGDDLYLPAERFTRSFEIVRDTQTITYDYPQDIDRHSGASYTPVATADSGLPVTFGATGACTIADGVVTFTEIGGVCTVTADQPGTAGYEPAQQRSRAFTVLKRSQTMTITSTIPETGAVGGTLVVTAEASSGLPVSAGVYGACSSAPDAQGRTVVTFTSVGTCTLNLGQNGNAEYDAAPGQFRTIEVGLPAQTLAFTSTAPATAAPGDTYTVTATGGASGQPVVLGATGACTIADAVVTFTATGTCTITADQAGDDRFQAAAQVSQTVAVGLLAGSVAFGGDAPTDARVGGSSTPVIVEGPSSADPVLAASGACSVASGVVSYDSAGTCTLTLNQAGDPRYGAAPQAVRTFEIARIAQTVAFTSTAPATAVAGGTYTPTATGGPSGKPVLIDATGSCSIASGVVTFTGSGTCTITADQAGDDRHAAAPHASQSIAVGLAAGTVSFGGDAPTGAAVGGSSTPVIVRGPSSADPVLAASGACSVASGVVSYDSAGTCTLTLDQAGDARYGAAPQAVRTFEITRVGQTLVFTSTAPAAVVGGAAYRPAVRGGASSAPVVLGTTTPSVCSVADGSVSFTAAGTCVLTADQAGDATHEAAPRATQSITVKAAVPAVKKAQTIAFTTTMPKAPERGVAYPVAATATSGNPVTFAAKGSCTLTATGRGTATVTLTGAATCTVTATQAGDATWLAAPAVTRTLKVDAATKADLTIAMTPTPGLGSTAPVSGTVTIKNVGTRDAGATTTRVTVSAPVADAPGAVRTPGKVKGTTVLTWTVPTVAAGQSITYTVKLATRPKVTTIDATVSTSLADPTPANNSLSRTVK